MGGLLGRLRAPGAHRAAREFAWIALGQGTAAVGSIVGVRLLTRAMSPIAYGELALGVTAVTFVQQTITGPVSQAALRYFAPAHEYGYKRSYLATVRRLLTEATLVVAAVAVIATALEYLLGDVAWLSLTLAALVLSLVSGYGAALDSVQIAARQRVIVAWHQGSLQWLRPVLALVLIVAWGDNSMPAMVGFVLASAAVLISQAFFFRRSIVRSWTGDDAVNADGGADLTVQMRAYAWPFASWGGFAWLQAASDRWALQAFRGSQSVGIYAAARQIGYNPFMLLSGLVTQWIAPILFARAGDGTSAVRIQDALELGRRIVVASLIGTVGAAACAALWRTQMFAILAGAQYQDGSFYLPLLALAGGLFASAQIASLLVMIGGDTRALIAPKIGAACIGLALNVAGAAWFGILGVVVAEVVFDGIYFVWVHLLAQRSYGRRQSGGRADVATSERW